MATITAMTKIDEGVLKVERKVIEYVRLDELEGKKQKLQEALTELQSLIDEVKK